MPINLKIILVLISFWLFFRTLYYVKKDKIPVRYALVWFLSSFILFFVGVFTNSFAWISSLIGFQVSSNLVVGIFITFLLLITRMLTKIVSEQNKKINLLIQEVSLLKRNIDEKK